MKRLIDYHTYIHQINQMPTSEIGSTLAIDRYFCLSVIHACLLFS